MAAKKRIKVKEGTKRKSYAEIKREKEREEALKRQETVSSQPREPASTETELEEVPKQEEESILTESELEEVPKQEEESILTESELEEVPKQEEESILTESELGEVPKQEEESILTESELEEVPKQEEESILTESELEEVPKQEGSILTESELEGGSVDGVVCNTDYSVRGRHKGADDGAVTTGVAIGDFINGGYVDLPKQEKDLTTPTTDNFKKGTEDSGESKPKEIVEHLNGYSNKINVDDLYTDEGATHRNTVDTTKNVDEPETHISEQVTEEPILTDSELEEVPNHVEEVTEPETHISEQVTEDPILTDSELEEVLNQVEVKSEQDLVGGSLELEETEPEAVSVEGVDSPEDFGIQESEEHVATLVTGESGESYTLDIELPPVSHPGSEMYEALVAYSEGGVYGTEIADLRGITHINIDVFDGMYGLRQQVLVGTDNTETIELPYEGRYIGVQHMKGIMLSPIQKELKSTYYVSYTGNFYLAANDLKKGKRVNLAGDYIEPVEPEEGVEAILVQREHVDGVTFEYKIRDLTDVNKRLGLKLLTPEGKVSGLTGKLKKPKASKPVKDKKSFFSKKSKGTKEAEMVNKSRPIEVTPKKGGNKGSKAPVNKKQGIKKVGKKQAPTKPYSRYSEEKPSLLTMMSSKTKAFLMGLGFMIFLLVIGSRLFAPSNTVDYLTFNEKETLTEVAEDSFGKAYVSKMENQALIYFEPRHKEVKVTFLEYLESYMNSGDVKLKKDLDTVTVQYFTNLEYVQKQALIKFQRNKQQGDTSELTLNFEKNHNKIQEVLGGSLKEYTGRVMNGYSDTATLRMLLGVETNQETSAFLSAFTDNIFYVYYNYVINQTDDLLAGVTDERTEEVQEGQESVNSEQTLEEAQEEQE